MKLTVENVRKIYQLCQPKGLFGKKVKVYHDFLEKTEYDKFDPDAIENYKNDIYELIKQVSYPNCDTDYKKMKYVYNFESPESSTWTEDIEDCKKLHGLYRALIKFNGDNYYVKDTGYELELTKLNVYRLMQECKATENSKNKIRCSFYDEKAGKKMPVLEFDKKGIDNCRETINYMLGQLEAVHKNKQYLSVYYGLSNYHEENWTNEDLALYSLYYLGVASYTLPPFKRSEKGSFFSPIGEFRKLKPTFWPPKR